MTQWLRDRTSSLDCGQLIFDRKTGKWHPVHANRNEVIRDYLNGIGFHPRALSNDRQANHFAKIEKWYYTASGPQQPETLITLDADAHHAGTLDDCLTFLRWANKKFRLRMHIEPSSDDGAHGQICLSKLGWNSLALKRLFLGQTKKNVQGFVHVLRHELKKLGLPIQIEIKGTPLELTRNDRGRVTNVVAGVPATVPQNRETFDEWRLNNKPVTAEHIQKLVSRYEAKSEPPTVPEKRKLRVVGSCSGCAIDEDELKRTRKGGHYYKLWSDLVQYHKLRTSSGAVVTFEDGAIFLMLLKFFSLHMNEDGTMPWARWGDVVLPDGSIQVGLWNTLYNEGDITRAFDCHRFAAIRDHLSSLELIDWKDQSYRKPVIIGNQKIKGRAAKWQASEQLMEMLEHETGEKRASLAGSEITRIMRKLVQLPEDETIRPTSVDPEPVYWWNGDEISPYVTSFDKQLAG